MSLGRFSTAVAATISILALSGISEAQTIGKASADRLEARINALAEFGKNADGGVDRVAYSEADKLGREHIIRELKALGLDVRVDAAANIIARRTGSDNSLKPILFGSHIDSVPGGGNYDGPTGVMASMEAIQLLNEAENSVLL